MLLVSESAGIKAVLFDARTYIFWKEGEKEEEKGEEGESGRKTVNERGRRVR